MDLVAICREEGRKQATNELLICPPESLDPYGGMIPPLQGTFDELA